MSSVFALLPVPLASMAALSPRSPSHARQGASFAVCGALGALIEFTILRILIGHYDISPVIAYIPSAAVPAVFVFFFNKFVTFGARGGAIGQSGRFIVVYASTFCFNYALSSTLFLFGSTVFAGLVLGPVVLTTDRVAYLAKAAAIGVTAVINYLLSHLFIYKRPLVPEAATIVSL